MHMPLDTTAICVESSAVSSSALQDARKFASRTCWGARVPHPTALLRCMSPPAMLGSATRKKQQRQERLPTPILSALSIFTSSGVRESSIEGSQSVTTSPPKATKHPHPAEIAELRAAAAAQQENLRSATAIPECSFPWHPTPPLKLPGPLRTCTLTGICLKNLDYEQDAMLRRPASLIPAPFSFSLSPPRPPSSSSRRVSEYLAERENAEEAARRAFVARPVPAGLWAAVAPLRAAPAPAPTVLEPFAAMEANEAAARARAVAARTHEATIAAAEAARKIFVAQPVPTQLFCSPTKTLARGTARTTTKASLPPRMALAEAEAAARAAVTAAAARAREEALAEACRFRATLLPTFCTAKRTQPAIPPPSPPLRPAPRGFAPPRSLPPAHVAAADAAALAARPPAVTRAVTLRRQARERIEAETFERERVEAEAAAERRWRVTQASAVMAPIVERLEAARQPAQLAWKVRSHRELGSDSGSSNGSSTFDIGLPAAVTVARREFARSSRREFERLRLRVAEAESARPLLMLRGTTSPRAKVGSVDAAIHAAKRLRDASALAAAVEAAAAAAAAAACAGSGPSARTAPEQMRPAAASEAGRGTGA